MRVNTQVKPGFFWKAGRQYIALSEVSRHLQVPAHIVTDAVSRGDLPIERVSGCKVVQFEELLRFIDLLEGRK
ncbi:hypothetical protein [Marinobacter sp.]|uniref:hypothetical protein n=1 Tax=Marinobacter sp. TaxID=50741 RepID=UPI0035C6B71F